MRVLVSGSSGLIASVLIPTLERAGHTIVRLVRPPKTGGPGLIPWDPAQGWIELSGLEGADAVVHLSGESLLGRWTADKKRRIRDSRVGSTRLLAESLARLTTPPRVLVCISASGYYGNRGDEVLTEDSPPGSGFLAELCREWEAAALPAVQVGIRVVHLRTGLVLAGNGGLLGPMLPAFRLGLGGPIGSGQQWWSWIAIDDLALAFRHALEHDTMLGPVNAVAPNPVVNAEFARAFGRVLGRPAAVPVPPIALRMLFGREAADEAMLTGARLVPGRLLAAGFRFEYPELEGALRHVLEVG